MTKLNHWFGSKLPLFDRPQRLPSHSLNQVYQGDRSLFSTPAALSTHKQSALVNFAAATSPLLKARAFQLAATFAMVIVGSMAAEASPRFMVVSHYGELPPHQEWNALQDGSTFRPFEDFIAAHRSLPIGTRLVLTNTENPHRSIVVTVLDRGPFINGRDLDISTAAAQALGIYEEGVTEVEVTPLE